MHNFFLKIRIYFFPIILILSASYIIVKPAPITYNADKTEVNIHTDFLFYYAAVELFKNGQADKIYSQELQQENFFNITGIRVNKLIPYLYPPQSILFFVPFSYLSFKNAYTIWNAVNIISSVFLIYLLCRMHIIKENTKTVSLTSFFLVISCPYIYTIFIGQVSILITICLLLYHCLAKRKKFFMAGLVISLLAFKPQILIAPVLYLLIIHGKELWKATIIMGIVTIIICTAYFDIGIWQSYIDILIFATNSPDEMGGFSKRMGNIRALILHFYDDDLSAINNMSALLWLSSIAIIVYIGFLLRTKSYEFKELGFALAITVNCLFNPWMHVINFIILVIPIAYLVKYSNIKSIEVWAVCLFFYNLLMILIGSSVPNYNFVLWIPLQILLIVLIVYRIKEGKLIHT